MDGLERLAAVQAARNGDPDGEYALGFDEKGKLKLPKKPELCDVDGLCKWLTAVFNLNPEHPITGGERQGLHGPEGHVELSRAGAPPLRFEPVTRVANPTRLREVLEGSALHTDGEPPGFKAEHTYAIAHVVRMLCGHAEGLSAEAETRGIVDAFLTDSTPVEGHTTYGTAGQRYEAAVALQHLPGPLADGYRRIGDHVTTLFLLRSYARERTARERTAFLACRRVELRGHVVTSLQWVSGENGRRHGLRHQQFADRLTVHRTPWLTPGGAVSHQRRHPPDTPLSRKSPPDLESGGGPRITGSTRALHPAVRPGEKTRAFSGLGFEK
jgi:hypothetical protein